MAKSYSLHKKEAQFTRNGEIVVFKNNRRKKSKYCSSKGLLLLQSETNCGFHSEVQECEKYRLLGRASRNSVTEIIVMCDTADIH